MRLNRCPACGAACSDTAEWCTLCYADLRPKQPTIEPAPPAEVAAPRTEVEPSAEPLVEDGPVLTASAATTAIAAEPRWPCASCGESMPLAESSCTVCGAPFLRDPVGTGLNALVAMPPGRRAGLMALGVLLATGVFLLLMLIVGSLL